MGNRRSQVSRVDEAEHQALKQRFLKVWQRSTDRGANPDGEAVWQELCSHYLEDHRLYHNLNHIAYSLEQLDQINGLTNERDAIELAIWFHDVIYRLSRSDNEAQSAELFQEIADGIMDEQLVDRVKELIVATTHQAPTGDAACQYMLDIDLAGFGLPWEAFVANSVAIREEQQSSPAAEIAFLDSLDRRERVFQSDYFHERLESRARENIAKYRADCESRETSC